MPQSFSLVTVIVIVLVAYAIGAKFPVLAQRVGIA